MGAYLDTMNGSTGEDDPSPPAKRRRTDEGDVSQEAEKVTQKPPEIDENFYSRQIYVLGRDAMMRLAQSDVLISGVGGLGVEIAKNVVLAGVRSVTIHDEQVCTGVDLSSQYFLGEATVGENRASACEAPLGQLNKYVRVTAHTEPLTMDFLKKFTNIDWCHFNSATEFTKRNRISVSFFCNISHAFYNTVLSCHLPNTYEKQGVVTTSHKARHGFEDGDYVTFSEVRGMTEINECPPMEIKVLAPHRFSVMAPYNGITGTGGFATELKMPKDVKFKPLKESLQNPEFVPCDTANADRAAQLHLGFQALHAFQEAHRRLPRAWDMYEAAEVVQLAKEKNALQANPLKEIDDRILTLLSCTSSGSLCPMQSVIGSIAAQEVIKACTGKFTPIHQWFYFDAFECLPQKASVPEFCVKEMELARYGAQACVFGSDVQRTLLSLNYLVVGAGAIGCELLKNLAMMGVGAGCGCIYLTDADKVEMSNLNRMFFFRTEDVGHSKAVAAANAALRMNPELNITSHEDKVGPETESVYNDLFFTHLNGVASAIDNVEGRRYIDRRCVRYCKPLVDSGTEGTKGSVQVVVPFVTESYTCSRDPPETSVPLCTIKYFPNKVEHTIEWARDEFEGLFKMSAVNAVKYLENPRFLSAAQKTLPLMEEVDLLQELMKILVEERAWVFDDCVEFARLRFQEQYDTRIRQMLRHYPEEQLTSKGTPFWSAGRRCPHPIEFDPSNTLHVDYIVAAANLRAAMFGIPQCTDREVITRMLEDVDVPVYDPHKNDAAVNEDHTVPRDAKELVCDLLEELPAPRDLEDLTLTALEFDVDDDSNFHLDFIVAASNLRAANYNIAPADRLNSKLVAGRIIPAIATTTSLVAGLACLELYKVERCDTL
ncbi:hypothetical protein HPB51_014282 [Rhipicephalus microplus]|uniref:E1 ubiquitin-activating enzyme n=1 Tax=Rhipicephalus microplus TaxID=6941 RepID=A0A9J6DUM9_RHIMP|nr:hypothetical protein HPB51_014282 [Rhipicephalus microplus]